MRTFLPHFRSALIVIFFLPVVVTKVKYTFFLLWLVTAQFRTWWHKFVVEVENGTSSIGPPRPAARGHAAFFSDN
jgi:hypothetical protein